MRASLLLVLTLIPTLARAEYRAFELVIRQTDGGERVEVSSLNPAEYRRYYPLPAGARIDYRATWRCPGNTSWHRPICPNPRAVAAPAPTAGP